MARISTPTNTRHEHIARIANQTAETALCTYAQLNGITFSDAEFAAAQIAIRDQVAEQLHLVDHAKAIAAYDEPAGEPLPVREPRIIPAVTERW